MKLSSLFTDGMVLQRNAKNLVWGSTIPNHLIEGTFADKKFSGIADQNGNFEIYLPELPAGGPYKLSLHADEEFMIHNVLVGDVFLLGGQSNMELPLNRTLERYRKELSEADEPDIRIFDVPKEYSLETERDEIDSGSWKKATGEDLLSFSALGYFTAKELKERYNVPIGLIQTAVGGTPAKAWCSEKTIYQQGFYIDELEQCKQDGYVKSVEREEQAREQEWYERAAKSFEGKKKRGARTGKVKVPEKWLDNELSGFHGAIRLTRSVYITQEQAEMKAELALGAIMDADVVFVNKTCIGGTGYMYPPRFYSLEDGILHEGENQIEIRMSVYRNTGGTMPGKDYGIWLGEKREIFLDLQSEWNYEICLEMEELPETTFFNYKAAALYNGMLYPVHKWNVSAFLYYQGESNTEQPLRYAEEMQALIADWRALWEKEEMPFVYVQLAGFSDGKEDEQNTEWAEFRHEQEKVLDVPNTAMATAFDIGEFNDLHPMNKKTLGYRVALAVRRLVYQEDVALYAAVPDRIEKKRGELIVTFSDENGYQMLDRKQANEIELKMSHGFVPAAARLEGNKLFVKCPARRVIKGIRYAWRDCPMNANLYNEEGLPVLPFCREWESV